MKKILSNQKKTTSAPAASSSPGPIVIAPKFTPRGTRKNRILIAVDEQKKTIDFAAMSSESAKELNELLHTPEVQSQFGIGPLRDRFDPQHCKRVYEALGLIMMGAGKFFFKWPDPALACLVYTEAEKEELGKPTAAVLDELAPKWLRENQAVAALALVFGAMTQNKIRAAALVAQQVKQKGTAAGVQPIQMPRVVVPASSGNGEVKPAEETHEPTAVNFGKPGPKLQ
jgi:hypothetical protein